MRRWLADFKLRSLTGGATVGEVPARVLFVLLAFPAAPFVAPLPFPAPEGSPVDLELPLDDDPLLPLDAASKGEIAAARIIPARTLLLVNIVISDTKYGAK